MAAVQVNALSGACVLHLARDSLLPGITVAELRGKVAEQLGRPWYDVFLLKGTEELQGCRTLEAMCAAGLELTAVVRENARYDSREDPEHEGENMPALARLLSTGDAAACRRLAEHAGERRMAHFLNAEALRAAVSLLETGDSEASDAALRVLASATEQRRGGPLSCEDCACETRGSDWEVPEAMPVTAEALAVRDVLLAAGALRALPAVWCRLWRQGKCRLPCMLHPDCRDVRQDLEHLLFRLLRGSPAPAPEDVAPALPLLMTVFRHTPRSPPLLLPVCVAVLCCHAPYPWRERDHTAMLCAQQLCCHAGHITALLDAGLLQRLRPLLHSRYYYCWRKAVLKLLHSICAHGTEEQHDRIVRAGWLPILLDARPQGLLGRQLLHRLFRYFDMDDWWDTVCAAYGLHIAAGLAPALCPAAQGQSAFLLLCELLRRLVAAGG